MIEPLKVSELEAKLAESTDHAPTSIDSRLLRYLRAKQAGGSGWSHRYYHSIGQSPAWMAGHYIGLLDDLIGLIGIDRAIRIACAIEEVDEQLARRKAEGRT